LNLKLRLKLYF